MPRDIRKMEESRRRRKHPDDDSSNSDSNSSSEDEEMDSHEYKKFLAKMFPSKYKKNQVKEGEKLKKLLNPTAFGKKKSKKEEEEEEESIDSEDSDEETDETYEPSEEFEEEEEPKKKSKKSHKKKNESEEDDDDEEDEEEEVNTKKNKYNIILHIGKKNDDYDEEDDNWEDISEEDEDINGIDTEDEDEPVSSSDEEDEEEDEKISKKKKMDKIKDVILENDEIKTNEELLVQLKEVYEKNKKNKSVLKCIEICEKEIKQSKEKKEKKERKQKDKNSRIFRKIIRDKNTNNDFDFFQKMEIDNQKKIIKELREINKVTRIEKPYRMTLLESNIPTKFKAAAMKKINSLRNMEPGSGEYYKIKNWVDTFMRMPFEKFENLSINIEDGVDKCHEFMENAQKTLDAAVYGLNDAKMQIMQMLGQLITNPKSIGTAIAIHGPPGTGKTQVGSLLMILFSMV